MSNHSQVIGVEPYGAPELHESVWVAPGALVVGKVSIGEGSSVWYNAVVRGDSDAVLIGERTNVQDGVAIHAMRGTPTVIGNDVSIGHNAVVHGASVGNGCLIGMNATVMNGAVIGDGALIAAGAVVPQGMIVPRHTLAAGVPARIIGPLEDRYREHVRRNSEEYIRLTAEHKNATATPAP